jgi:competence protein ComEA
VGVAAAIVLAVSAAIVATSGADGDLVIDAAAQAGAITGAPSSRPTGTPGAGATLAVRTGAGTSGGSSDPRDIVVEVNGAVRRPGLYHLSLGSRVGDAIAAAGGYSGRIDAIAAQSLNLAARVTDGQQIHAPGRDERIAPDASSGAGAGAARGAGGAAPAPTGPVDLNSATAPELEALPAIGPATAAKIIAARQERRFGSVQELRDRKIVGAATLARIKDLVTVR